MVDMTAATMVVMMADQMVVKKVEMMVD